MTKLLIAERYISSLVEYKRWSNVISSFSYQSAEMFSWISLCVLTTDLIFPLFSLHVYSSYLFFLFPQKMGHTKYLSIQSVFERIRQLFRSSLYARISGWKFLIDFLLMLMYRRVCCIISFSKHILKRFNCFSSYSWLVRYLVSWPIRDDRA